MAQPLAHGAIRTPNPDAVSADAWVPANATAGTESTFYAAVLDRAQNVVATWEPGAALPYQLVPALDTASGRIFVQGGNVDGRQLELRELGCVR